MRIIGQIEHPILKITVFKMDNRLSVKFETGLYEQTYKFRTGEGIESFDDVVRIVDAPFQAQVLSQFNLMREAQFQALNRHRPLEEPEEFDRII